MYHKKTGGMNSTLVLSAILAMVVTASSASSISSSSKSSIVMNEMSDWEKLTSALGGLSFTSVDELLQILGLANMPRAHLYGMAGGCVTFLFTLAVVAILLLKGGTFHRLVEQLQMPKQQLQQQTNAVVTTRKGRPLLYERLLETRVRLMKTNYLGRYQKHNCNNTNSNATALTNMLLNVVAPTNATISNFDKEKTAKKNTGFLSFVNKMVKDTNTNADNAVHTANGDDKDSKDKGQSYELNYAHAYRRCQDKPGGNALPGYPDARIEAYAFAYAGCPPQTSTTYRRSYARVYEAVSCASQKTMEHYKTLMQTNPQDIIGRTVRLQSLDTTMHARDLFHALGTTTYDDELVWCFSNYGPFQDSNEMVASNLFQRLEGEAAFAIYQQVTEKLIGCILLRNDDPQNLSIDLEAVYMPTTQDLSSSSNEELETCFLILDRLFAFGYRRIQMTCDTADSHNNKLATRLGFIIEGTLPKHRIIKDANSDSNIFALTNTEWSKGGVRTGLFKKLHGSQALAADARNEIRESELEMWELKLTKGK